MEATFDPLFDMAFEGGLLQEIKIAEVGICEGSNNNFHGLIPIKLFYDDELKGHGKEADFLGFLHKPVRHRSLTLSSSHSDFSFKFSDICNRKITPRLAETGNRQINTIFFQTFK